MRWRRAALIIAAGSAAAAASTHIVDAAQVANGVAAVVGVWAAHYAFVHVTPRVGLAWLIHGINVTLLTWYAVVNLLLGFGVFRAEVVQVVPLFRYAFAPLLLSVAARQWLAAKRTITL